MGGLVDPPPAQGIGLEKAPDISPVVTALAAESEATLKILQIWVKLSRIVQIYANS